LAGGELALATIQEAVAKVVPERPAVVWRQAGITHAELTTRCGAVPLAYLGDRVKTLETFPEIAGMRYSIPVTGPGCTRTGRSNFSVVTTW
jgi:hypothetical protein